MKILWSFCCLFLTAFCALFAQSHEHGYIAIANTKSGLVVHNSPSISAMKVAVIPENNIFYYYEKIAHTEVLDLQDSINGIKDYWRQVYYNGYYGYVFGAYLKKYEAENIENISNNIYGVMSNNIAIYGEPYTWSNTVAKVHLGNEVYVFSPKSIPKDNNKNVFIKVRFKDKVGYISSKELKPLSDLKILLSDYHQN